MNYEKFRSLDKKIGALLIRISKVKGEIIELRQQKGLLETLRKIGSKTPNTGISRILKKQRLTD